MSTPPIDAASFAAQRDQALIRFGAMLQAWRVRNGWTQHTAQQWATAAGFRALTAGNYSKLERGLSGSPSPSTIFQLADLNRRIHAKDWGVVRDRNLRQRIQEATPIVDEQGIPWALQSSGQHRWVCCRFHLTCWRLRSNRRLCSPTPTPLP